MEIPGSRPDPDPASSPNPVGPTVRRFLRDWPVLAAVSLVVEAPFVAFAVVSADPLAWLLAAGGYFLAAAAVVGALGRSPAERASLRRGLAAVAGHGRELIAAYALAALGLVLFAGSLLLLIGAVGLGLFGVFVTIVATISLAVRGVLVPETIVDSGADAAEAFEVSWQLMEGLVVELSALFALLSVLAVGPAIAAGIVLAAAGTPSAVTTVTVAVVLAVSGPILPVGFAALYPRLEARRRALDPKFRRP
jgi:hypothetical protein